MTDFTRAISELLMAINGLKGQLSIPVLKSTDETTTKADIESSLGREIVLIQVCLLLNFVPKSRGSK